MLLLLTLACDPASLTLGHDLTRTARPDTASDTAETTDTGADTADTADTGADTADTDTGADTADTADTGADTADTGCAEAIELDAEVVAWVWPASPASVGITGCMTTLTVTCPSWIFLSYTPTSVYEGVPTHVELSPVSGTALPVSGTCDVGGVSLAVEYTY